MLRAQQMNTIYNALKSYQKLAIASAIFGSALDAEAQPPGLTAMPPYTVSVFATPPAGLRNPDSITTANGNMIVSISRPTRSSVRLRARR